MAEMVASAFVQEAVSRAVSSVLGDGVEQESGKRKLERLEMAHAELESALERSKKLPITDASLLRRRRIFKRKYEECGEVLDRCKLQVLQQENEADDPDHQAPTLSSLPRRIFLAARSAVSSSFGSTSKGDETSCSNVARFEWYACKAGEFARDVSTGCSLSHHRFFSPLLRRLFKGKSRWYEVVRGSRADRLLLAPMWSEQRGLEAWVWFTRRDHAKPSKNFALLLMLRLSESTDVVGIIARCLRSLAPVFQPFAEVATGELAQLATQCLVPRGTYTEPMWDYITAKKQKLLPDPLCYAVDAGHGSCASSVTPKFPAQVFYMSVGCFVQPFDCSSQSQLQGSGDGGARRSAPLAELKAFFAVENYKVERVGGQEERQNASLRQAEEMVLTKAICRFFRQPELTVYLMRWRSAHGDEFFRLWKPRAAMASALQIVVWGFLVARTISAWQR